MKGVTVITHPLVQHSLARLRDKETQPQEFRRLLGEIASLMIYEANAGTFDVKKIVVANAAEAAADGLSRLKREVVLVPGFARWAGNAGFHFAVDSARACRFYWVETRGNDFYRRSFITKVFRKTLVTLRSS